MAKYNAILIPGGGIQPDGTPNPWVAIAKDVSI